MRQTVSSPPTRFLITIHINITLPTHTHLSLFSVLLVHRLAPLFLTIVCLKPRSFRNFLYDYVNNMLKYCKFKTASPCNNIILLILPLLKVKR